MPASCVDTVQSGGLPSKGPPKRQIAGHQTHFVLPKLIALYGGGAQEHSWKNLISGITEPDHQGRLALRGNDLGICIFQRTGKETMERDSDQVRVNDRPEPPAVVFPRLVAPGTRPCGRYRLPKKFNGKHNGGFFRFTGR